jgi:hypothetical protein
VKARKVRKLDPEAPFAEAAARIVRVRSDELHSFVPRALQAEETEALHDMRIAAKRLRYLLETTGFCFGDYAETAAKRARELQDLLGEIHDCDVMLPRVLARLEDLRAADSAALSAAAGAERDLEPVTAGRAAHRDEYPGLEALVVWLRARRALLFERFLDTWGRLERRNFRPRLERALGERPTGRWPRKAAPEPPTAERATSLRRALGGPAPRRT